MIKIENKNNIKYFFFSINKHLFELYLSNSEFMNIDKLFFVF